MNAQAAAERVIGIQGLELCLEKAINEIATTMLNCSSEIIPYESVEIVPPGLSAIVGFGGKISGFIAINLSPSSACTLAANMLGMEIREMDDIVADAMGEIVNMLAGGMKKNACEYEDLFKISIPTIVYGSDYSTHAPKNSQRLFMGIKTDFCAFSVQLVYAQS
jgi:chemotaxis protein CheX